MKSKHSGFTLIELLIAVAIIGIIAGIAYPSYQQQMMESRREDAHVALLRMWDSQEKFYLQNNTYTATVANVGGTGTENNWYTLAVTSANASTFLLTATAGGAQSGDAGCITITLNQAGQKLPTTCW